MKLIALVILFGCGSFSVLADEQCEELRAKVSQLDEKRLDAYLVDQSLSEAAFETIGLAIKGLIPLTRIEASDGTTYCSAASFMFYNRLNETFNKLNVE